MDDVMSNTEEAKTCKICGAVAVKGGVCEECGVKDESYNSGGSDLESDFAADTASEPIS